MTAYYDHHIFLCANQRDPGRACCAAAGAKEALAHAKLRVRELLPQGSNVRVNAAGCLGRCEFGPALVVYPRGTWYTYVDIEDIDEIISSHLRDDVEVERLKIKG